LAVPRKGWSINLLGSLVVLDGEVPEKKLRNYFAKKNGTPIFAVPIRANWHGDVAQSVEQRTENPCVGGSIPSITTTTP
jgi:hypothetical protein